MKLWLFGKGRVLCDAVPCAVQLVLILSPQYYPEDSLVAVLSSHISSSPSD